MGSYVGYIRVSTAKQGTGVSLQAQREAIEGYAKRRGLLIDNWLEERETAAKTGRRVFAQVIELLRRRKIRGVIMHKIDRSARNHRDWADLDEWINNGQVHFAAEGIDLTTRGGRLSADIQAVVAVDYIRNLREEAKKGFYGRLKQGVFPLPAPLGYKDMGAGKPKEPDPVTAPFVKKAFELYATGNYGLENLAQELSSRGCRNRTGKSLTFTHLSKILNNPFYIGIMYLRKTGETFQGAHQPLIKKSLFDRVQLILKGKFAPRNQVHDFLFRQMIKCRSCNRVLVGEKKKGHVYYRCHKKTCRGVSLREETIENEILRTFAPLQFSEQELKYIGMKLPQMKDEWQNNQQSQLAATDLRLRNLEDRLNRLTDAYIDRLIERDVFEGRKAGILMEQQDLKEKRMTLTNENGSSTNSLQELLELAQSTYLRYKSGTLDEKRDLLKIVCSNLQVSGKNVEITLKIPFHEIANRSQFTLGGPYRGDVRTLDSLLAKLMEQYAIN